MKLPHLTIASGILGLLCALPAALHAQMMQTVTDTEIQSNFNGATGANQTAPIAAQPFTFSSLPAFTSIQSVSITLTVIDGDTGLGANGIDETPYPPPGNNTNYGDDDFDVNSWTLQLNGVNLGPNLLLNGFNADPNSTATASDFVTVTITGSPANADTLLTQLMTGSLTALIFDSTGAANSNGFEVPNTLINHTTPLSTTLSITGIVPEPSAVYWLAVGAGIIACAAHFHRRVSMQEKFS